MMMACARSGPHSYGAGDQVDTGAIQLRLGHPYLVKTLPSVGPLNFYHLPTTVPRLYVAISYEIHNASGTLAGVEAGSLQACAGDYCVPALIANPSFDPVDAGETRQGILYFPLPIGTRKIQINFQDPVSGELAHWKLAIPTDTG